MSVKTLAGLVQDLCTSLAETGSELDWHAQDNAVVIRLLAPRARFSLRIDLSLLARAETAVEIQIELK